MDETARFSLPQLAPGQLQKEFFHNEALQLVDMLLCPVVEAISLAAPPPSPALGACYIVATGASGAWAGQDGKLAGYCEGGWRFVAPIDGMAVIDRGTGHMVVRRTGSWEPGILRAQELRVDGLKVVGQRQPAIADPSGGSTVDPECRGAVIAMLATLRAHGLIA